MKAFLRKNVEYFVLTCLTLTSSFFICMNGQWAKLHKAIVTPSFYLTMLLCSLITFGFLLFIRLITQWLNKKYSWQKQKKKRMWYQILYGIIYLLLADLLLNSIHYYFLGSDIISSGFLSMDFPHVVWFIIAVNLFYIYYFSKNKTEEQPSLLIINYNRVYTELDVQTEVLYFLKSGKIVKVITIHGRIFITNIPLSQLEQKYQRFGLCRISLSTIVNLKYVKGIGPGKKRDTKDIILFAEQQKNISTDQNELYSITKKYLKNFIQSLNAQYIRFLKKD